MTESSVNPGALTSVLIRTYGLAIVALASGAERERVVLWAHAKAMPSTEELSQLELLDQFAGLVAKSEGPTGAKMWLLSPMSDDDLWPVEAIRDGLIDRVRESAERRALQHSSRADRDA